MALASDVLSVARNQLLDVSPGNRWLDPELLQYLTLGQREVCTHFPTVNAQTLPVTPGATDVRLDLVARLSPTVISSILRIANGHDEVANLEGYAIPVVERFVLDALDPAWVSYRPSTAAVNNKAVNKRYYRAAVLDPKDPFAIWLYPRAHPDFRFYVTVAVVPAAVATTGATLALPDQYVSALADYVIYRALAKDSLYTGAPNKAGEFYNSFMQKLGLDVSTKDAGNPTAARAPQEH